MPSPKYKARKPRPRPNVDVPFAPSFAAIPSIVQLIRGGAGELGGIYAIILLFNKPVGPNEPDPANFVITDVTNEVLAFTAWNYPGQPYGDNTRPGLAMQISYEGQGQPVATFEYRPVGYDVGDEDGTGIPIKVPIHVTLDVGTIMEGNSA